MIIRRYWIEASDEWGPVGVVECSVGSLGQVEVKEGSFGDVLEWSAWVEGQTDGSRMIYYATAATQKVLDRWWSRPMIDPLALLVGPDDGRVPTLEDVNEAMREQSQLTRADYLMELTLCLWMSVGRVDPWIARAREMSTGSRNRRASSRS